MSSSLPNQPSVDAVQHVEQLLKAASNDATKQADFFRALMEATVFVLGEGVPETPTLQQEAVESEAAKQQALLDLQHWEKQDGSSVIPFFTSVEALQRAVNEQQPFVAMPTRALFELTLGEPLFLNPKSDYSKEFFPQEVAQLLRHGGLPAPQQQIIDSGSSLLIGPATDYPTELVQVLTRLFQERKVVRRAFVALIQETGQQPDGKPNLLIGLELDISESEAETLIEEIGNLACEVTPEGEPIDICLVNEQEPGISHYLITHMPPFYQRKWGSWLRNIIIQQ